MRGLAEHVRERIPSTARRRIVGTRFALRRPTAKCRSWPDFLVVGTMRGGTSSLFKYLCQHPDLRRPLRKETEYLGLDFDHDLDWYRTHFPIETPGRRWKTFEATPYYLFHPHSAARAAAILPEIRVIGLLRDPVERAYSHYEHMVRSGHESLAFADALDVESARLEAALAPGALEGGRTAGALAHHRHSYVARGWYLPQILRWEQTIGPSRCLWLFAEDLYREPLSVLSQIADHVSISRWTPKEFRNFSYEGGQRNRSAVPPIERRSLLGAYVPGYGPLAAHLGRELPWDVD